MAESRLKHGKKDKTKKGTLRQHVNNAYKRSPDQEAELAKQTKGRLTPRSGAGKEKGDVRVKGVARLEAKTTSRKSFSVTRKMLEKLDNAAIPTGEIPAHIIEFLKEDGTADGSVAVIPLWALLDLLERAR